MPGKSLFPMARVQRILKADEELPSCAREAVVLISIATEEFIKRLALAGHLQAKREQRLTVAPKDFHVASKRQDEFLFLDEILNVTTKPPRKYTKSAPKKSAPAGPNSNNSGYSIQAAFQASTSTSQSMPPMRALAPMPPPSVEVGGGDAMDVS
ncbi:hypothetical protein SISSUDRAFT_1043989 [Sistotremastrum suecicum HHB10207 ss-3]|uniref:Transcription factor CBF/NF-Y/archaeal histone domain-containing protein n=1 Tax=Sistotremastrum suecicum HHB10207 ss-3 TaxID=1314776 RepID=A0A166FHS4_9AGAM|nr:hypothetical protein SISSUDRAFT_1043989 [Sistotremastrum suecicum HHB10207 ss-3]